MHWRLSASCAQVDLALWFPEKGESPREAKAVCARCPVRVECLDYALDSSVNPLGIWGGTTERERRRMRRAGSAVAA